MSKLPLLDAEVRDTRFTISLVRSLLANERNEYRFIVLTSSRFLLISFYEQTQREYSFALSLIA